MSVPLVNLTDDFNLWQAGPLLISRCVDSDSWSVASPVWVVGGFPDLGACLFFASGIIERLGDPPGFVGALAEAEALGLVCFREGS